MSGANTATAGTSVAEIQMFECRMSSIVDNEDSNSMVGINRVIMEDRICRIDHPSRINTAADKDNSLINKETTEGNLSKTNSTFNLNNNNKLNNSALKLKLNNLGNNKQEQPSQIKHHRQRDLLHKQRNLHKDRNDKKIIKHR